jgi:DNA-binding winged helix-turn-helix (wHTH) protein
LPEAAATGVPGKESPLPAAAAASSSRSLAEKGLTFAGFRLEPYGSLFRGEKPVHLPPKELAALEFLLAHTGQIVTPQQLKQALWGDVHVTSDSVPKCISSLRALLEPEDCIQTVYKRGYRLSAEVRSHFAAPAPALPRLAIPPFATHYGVPEHLGLAVAEETIARLTRVHQTTVSVLARDSVFTLALRGFTGQQIGEALHADLVLTGILRVLPSHFRLRIEMVRVEDGTQIWVEDVLVDRSRSTGLEMELVNRLAFRLNTARSPSRAEEAPQSPAAPRQLLETSSTRQASSGARLREHVPPATGKSGVPDDRSSSAGWKSGVPDDRSSSAGLKSEGLSIRAAGEPFIERRKRQGRKDAFEIYQRAHHEWQTLQRHRMQDGLQQLSQAIELDPSLFAAKVDLVHLCVTQAFYGFMAPAVCADLVRRTAEPLAQAVRSGGELPTVLPAGAGALLPALGWISFHVDHNLPKAIHAFSLSAHLPHDPWITRLRVMLALSRHRFDEAIQLLRATMQQDPYSPWLHNRLAWALHLAGQATESVDQIRQGIKLYPDHEGSSIYGALILAFHGETARAIELAQELEQRSPYFDIATAAHSYALACAGRTDEARAILERLQWLSRERYVISSFNPAVHVALGDNDAALAALRTSADTRCPWFFQMLADPRLTPLHGRPEFEEMRLILSRMEAAAAHTTGL